ncbi:hypothetical protein [Asinibacterium sp. OR53]|uniref:hypothetical protein n=1 Tax=Asinibacterium sp. OR53 TaxID=925409 RepID=UPI0004B25D34|nr:hypothetical protein [Asinibacterium sp. OR53]
MKQSAANKYWWIALTAIFVAVVYLSSFIHERIDLTAEKRYSLSPRHYPFVKRYE